MNEQQKADWLQRMKAIVDTYDREQGHIDADMLLCEIVETLGGKEIVQVFNGMPKWYA